MSKQMQELFAKCTTRVKSIAFHPSLPTLVTGNHCGTIYVWNYHYGQPIATLHEHVGSVRVVRFHPSGELFASGGDDKVVRVWNYKMREIVKELRGHTDYVRSVDFHPTRPWLMSGSDDSTIKIWNYYTGEMLCSSSGHSHYIMSSLFLDSTHIATASLDHTICLWNCSNLFDQNKKFMVPGVVQCQTVEAHERGINTLFFKDGLLYSGADDKEIRIWSYTDETLMPLKTLYSQEGNVSSVFAGDGMIAGASEDGTVSVYEKDGKLVKIDVGPRCWAVASKDGNIAIGTDEGLVMYRRGGQVVHGVSGKAVYHLRDAQIMKTTIGGAADEGTAVCRIDSKEVLQRVYSADEPSDRLVLQYPERYEIVEHGRRIEGNTGQAVVYAGDVFKLHGDALYRDGGVVSRDVKGRLISTAWGIFAVDAKRATLCYSLAGAGGALSTSYLIRDIKTTPENLFVLGSDKISVYGKDLGFVQQLDEKVEITDGCAYHNEEDGDDAVFVYATVRQLKYYYEGFGTLQSLNTYVVPLAMAGAKPEESSAELFYLSRNGLDSMPVNVGELRFRRAVRADEGILSVIESEHLPGLSPLKYLISKGKGAVALPYIKDSNSRFSLFLSVHDFESALDICDTPQMYNELALKAFESGCYDVSEQCFTCIGDQLSLFFQYLSTKQIEKMKSLIGGEAELMVKLVLEDRSLFETLIEGDSLEGAPQVKVRLGETSHYATTESKELPVKDGDSGAGTVSDQASHEEHGVWGGVSGDEYMGTERLNPQSLWGEAESSHSSASVAAQGLPDTKGRTAEESGDMSAEERPAPGEDGVMSASSSDANLTSFSRSSENGENKIERRLEGLNVDSDEAAGDEQSSEQEELHKRAAPKETPPSEQNDAQPDTESLDARPNDVSEDSALFSNRTSVAAVNDSEPRLHMFDPSLLRDKPIEDLDAAMREALSFTTDGKFPLAVELFRDVVSAIALRMRVPEDYLGERKKAGVYLWGLCTEIERRKLADPRRSIQLALFFSSLPMEPKHSSMARTLAVNLCHKNGNFATARKLAARLPRNKITARVLESEAEGDKHDVEFGELCFDTLTIESHCKTCPMCFVKSKYGDVCGACQIGLIE